MDGTRQNVFITGKAGTGKSTLLEYFRAKTRKRIAVLAPTGVAAVNVKGETIHSFFGFKPDVSLDKIKRAKRKDEREKYTHLDAIVIDEISMVRADLMDCLEKFLRLNVDKKRLFGGLQMIFIGDLYQLPPVVTRDDKEVFQKRYDSPYFFSARVFGDDNFEMEFVELEKIYRQKDDKFIEFLNQVRNNSITETQVEEINGLCLRPDFQDKDGELYVYLTPTNQAASRINHSKLCQLKTEELVYQAETKGDFKPEHLPTDEELHLKKGAQVMMLNNDTSRRWVNGSIGRITDAEYDSDLEDDIIWVEFPDGRNEAVAPFLWSIYHYVYNPDTGSVESEAIGTFRQYPMKLAWAVTIHKSQGKTFDRVVLDIGRGTFAHGQMYVALSRCTSLGGLVFKKRIDKKNIWMDWRVVKFVTQHQYNLADKKNPLKDKIKLIEKAISNKQRLDIVYLKANDTKSARRIEPFYIGELDYNGKQFLGVRARCLKRGGERVFRVDRMLEVRQAIEAFEIDKMGDML